MEGRREEGKNTVKERKEKREKPRISLDMKEEEDVAYIYIL